MGPEDLPALQVTLAESADRKIRPAGEADQPAVRRAHLVRDVFRTEMDPLYTCIRYIYNVHMIFLYIFSLSVQIKQNNIRKLDYDFVAFCFFINN